jgi:hypothetical protein
MPSDVRANIDEYVTRTYNFLQDRRYFRFETVLKIYETVDWLGKIKGNSSSAEIA